MNKVDADVDTFLRDLPEQQRQDMITLDREISRAMPGESRTLWEGKFWGGSDQRIIGYGDYTYQRPRKQTVEWYINGLAAQKNYISVYINGVEDGQYLTEKYGPSLGKVKVGKSSISFKKLEDVDLDRLIDLVKRSRQAMREPADVC